MKKIQPNKCVCLGLMDIPRIESARRVYHWGGASPTVMTNAENDIKVLVYETEDLCARKDLEERG